MTMAVIGWGYNMKIPDIFLLELIQVKDCSKIACIRSLNPPSRVTIMLGLITSSQDSVNRSGIRYTVFYYRATLC